jgi:hypothetical protein
MGAWAEPVWCSHVSIPALTGLLSFAGYLSGKGRSSGAAVGQVLRPEKPALSLQVCEIERAANRVDERFRPAGPVAITHDEPYGHSEVGVPVLA